MKRRGIDDVDIAILNVLVDDGRISNSEIARRTDLPESTVRSRLQRLIRDDYLQITAMPNPDRWEKAFEIVVFVKADPSSVREVASAFTREPAVRSVRRITGGIDLIVTAAFDNDQALLAFVDRTSALPGVRDVEFNRTLHLYKGQYVLTPGWAERENRPDGTQNGDGSSQRCR